MLAQPVAAPTAAAFRKQADRQFRALSAAGEQLDSGVQRAYYQHLALLQRHAKEQMDNLLARGALKDSIGSKLVPVDDGLTKTNGRMLSWLEPKTSLASADKKRWLESQRPNQPFVIF